MTRSAGFLGLLLLAFMCACGSGSQPTIPTTAPTATATQTGTAATIHYQLTVSGTTALSQQFLYAAGVAGRPETCAQFVGGGGGRFYQLLGANVGSTFAMNLDIVPYNGPGVYTTTTSQLEFDVTSGGSFHPPVGTSGEQQGLRLTTRADGSGIFTISGWADVNDQAKTESGTLSWTCRNG